MSTERISRLQGLLERIKKNAVLPKRSAHLVFTNATDTRSDVSAGPSVPSSSLAQPHLAQTDVAVQAPLTPIRAVEVESAPVPQAAAGATRIPTISGMVSPLVETETAAKPAPALEVIEELDIDDVDLVDITTEPPPPPEPSSVEVAHLLDVEPTQPPVVSVPPVEVRDDELSWSEPPADDSVPDSSPRPRAAATSLDEALAEAAESESTEPFKTPPPESGRQPTDGIYAATIPGPAATDFMPRPTPEQLGQTLDLEAPTSAELELDIPVTQAQSHKEELEFELPPRESVLERPSEAAEPDSQVPQQSQVRTLPEEIDTIETPAVATPQEVPAPSTDRDSLPPAAELTARQTEGKDYTPEFAFGSRKVSPQSFAELLDASLSLLPKE